MIKIYVFLLLIFTSSSYAKLHNINLSYIDLPPHIQTINGKPKGLIVDYLNYILKGQTNITVSLNKLPFKRAWFNIKNKRSDGFLTLIETKERRVHVTYLESNFIEVIPSLCKKTGGKLKKKSRVAIISETIIPSFLKHIKYKIQKVHGSNFLNRAIKLLETNRVDYIYHPESLSLLWAIDKSNINSKVTCKAVGQKQKISIGFTKKTDMSSINILKKLIESKISYKEFSLNQLRQEFKTKGLIQYLNKLLK